MSTPVRNLQTMLRAIAKADARVPMPIPNGVFDAETEAALRAIQKLHRLPETGAADLDTWNAVRETYHNLAPLVEPAEPLTLRWEPLQIIAPGKRNTHLFLIQGMLRGLGEHYANLPPVEVTGVHDEKSVAAVRWLQKLANLPDDGVIDQRTWKALACLYRMTAGAGCGEGEVERRGTESDKR